MCFPRHRELILPQLARDVQNDIILTQVLLLDRAAQAGLLTDGARSGVWADPLVIAEPIGAPGDAGSGMFAVSELASASGIDGASIVSRMNLPANRVVSAIDNTEVVFLLTTGRARTGLLYLTDVHSGPGLRVVRAIEDPPPMLFAAAVTKLARRPNPAAFIHFMGTPGAAAMLTEVGLDARS
jgi:molybdate transport system substrate-binding protein